MTNAQGVAYTTERGKAYEKYIKSKAWSKKRAQYWARAGRSCKVKGCGSTSDLQVHHHTYERLGKENLFDLVGVCKSHHEEIHALHDATGREESLTRVTERVTGLTLRNVKKTTLPSVKQVAPKNQRSQKKSAKRKKTLVEIEAEHRDRPRKDCNCRSCKPRSNAGKKVSVLDTVSIGEQERTLKRKRQQLGLVKGQKKRMQQQKIVATRAARTKAHEQAQAVARQIAAARSK